MGTRDQLPPGYRWNGKKVRARFDLPTGRPIEPSFDTFAEAYAWRTESLAAKAAGRPHPDPRAFKAQLGARYITFSDASDRWQQRRERNESGVEGVARSARMLENHHKSFFGNRRLHEIGADDVEAFRDHLVDIELASSYQTKLLWAVRAVFDFAIKKGWVNHNPGDGVRAKKCAAELERERSDAWRDFVGLEWELAMQVVLALREIFRIGFWIQFICGLRVGELFGLQLGDWNSDARVLYVHAQAGKQYLIMSPTGAVKVWRVERTKTKAGRRIVGVPSQLAQAIDQYIAQYHSESPANARLIVTPNGGKSYSSYAAAVTKAFRQCGVTTSAGEPATPHYLRACALSNFTRAGINGAVHSYLAGHEAPALEGAAKITVRTYFVGLHAVRVRRLADLLGSLMSNEGLVDLNCSAAAGDDDFLTWRQASALAKVDESTLRASAASMAVELRRDSALGTRVRQVVSRASVEAFVASRNHHLSMREAADHLGFGHHSSVRSLAISLNLLRDEAITRNERWLDDAALRKMEEAVRLGRDFRDKHYTATEAAQVLRVPPATVDRRIHLGIWPTAEPPVWVPAAEDRTFWLEKSMINAIAAGPRSGWLRVRSVPDEAKGRMSVKDAAKSLRYSLSGVRSLYRTGVLRGVEIPVEGKPKIWLDPGSVMAYRDGDRRALRRAARALENVGPSGADAFR